MKLNFLPLLLLILEYLPNNVIFLLYIIENLLTCKKSMMVLSSHKEKLNLKEENNIKNK